MERQDARDAKKQEPDETLDRLVADVLAACVEAHRVLGPGFLESIYEAALCIELDLRNVPFRRQVPIAVPYKGRAIGQHKLDLVVADRLIIELKTVEALAPIHASQVRSYLKATKLMLGLLVNFNVPILLRGVRRIILSP